MTMRLLIQLYPTLVSAVGENASLKYTRCNASYCLPDLLAFLLSRLQTVISSIGSR